MSRPRRTGRPRRRAQSASDDPVIDIMAAASTLFGDHGVTGTTMARIAAAAGLQQSSLYYYFRSKDDVLAAILAAANVIPLELVRTVSSEPCSAAVSLYRFVRGDVVALCALPFDINEVHRHADRDRQRFATYWKERRTLQTRLAAIVGKGVKAGQLRDVNTRLAAITVMSNDEAVQNWFRHDTKPIRDPHAIGRFVADLTVAGLLVDSADLAATRRVSDTLDGGLSMQHRK